MARIWDRSTVDALLKAATPSATAESLGIAVVRRAGSPPRALCPFHEDHEPSLVLYDRWEARPPHYHCFACGADGDIFSLVKGVRQTSFAESVDWLAELFRVPTQKPSKTRKNQDRKSVLSWDGNLELAFSAAQNIYRTRNGRDAILSWLVKRRLPVAIADAAGLVLAQRGTLTGELQHLLEQEGRGRVELEMLEEAGLLRAIRQPGDPAELFASVDLRYRDFFSEPRILFPVKNLDGKTVGFAGRLVGEASSGVPKYLYSPRLPKSSLLYRGDVALERLKSQSKEDVPCDLFICEGIVDALRLECAGLAAVAVLGAQVSKEQIAVIQKISDSLQPGTSVRVHIFLDRDKAGIRGASKLAASLAESGIESTYIWPTRQELEELQVPTSDQKDPDSIFSLMDEKLTVRLLNEWRRPPALAVISVRMGTEVTPDDILDNTSWSAISLGSRYRAAVSLSRESHVSAFLLDTDLCSAEEKARQWYRDVIELRGSASAASAATRHARSSVFIEKVNARLNIARALAKSGAERGEVPSDEAAWRRIDAGATAFNIGLQERLTQATFEPLEPFDAVMVARDFEKKEPRLKAMPCPEDLVLQQYMLAEVLTERFDKIDDPKPFSLYVPAVRYYRDSRTTETTGEDGTFERRTETLSFAYQVDMDVLEGRRRASSQGMFRPYIECWRDFISSLRHKAQDFDEVFAIRLDVKRYYDRLTRTTVRDSLKTPLDRAIGRLTELDQIQEFAPDFQTGKQNLSDSLTDWFCDQSFDYEFYDPMSGKISKTKQGIGIPQGPILSAWLATVALFPMDAALRKELADINGDSGAPPRAAYARYVDDIFLIADSPTLLQRLRAVAEESARQLRLEVAQKGEMAPRMSAAEFRELLTEGKALVGSGPTPELGLLHLGDGEAGYDTWQESVQRSSALVLLSDRKLYDASVAALEDQIFTALNAHDLRPSELPKASRWIWYAVASGEPHSVGVAWQAYWEKWQRLTRSLSPKLSVEGRPWHDPSIYALDGLERILSSANVHDKRLPSAAARARKQNLGVLSKLVLSPGFFAGFLQPSANAPKDAGSGARQLPRMFLQRSVCVRWIARQLTGQPSETPFDKELGSVLEITSTELRGSLSRAWLTDADGSSFPLEARANDGASPFTPSPLRPAFIWLHEAIVLLSRAPKPDTEQLESIAGSLRTLKNNPYPRHGTELSLLMDSTFYKVLSLWLPDKVDHASEDTNVRVDALSALLAVCHIDGLTACLSRRGHLLNDFGRVLPALPGVPTHHLILLKCTGTGSVAQLDNIRQLYAIHVAAPSVLHQEASGLGVHGLQLAWSESELSVITEKMIGRTAAWTSSACRVFAEPPSRPAKFSRTELTWAADCFELLAHLNSTVADATSAPDDTDGAMLEFAPAWPYLAASVLPSGTDGDTRDTDVSVSLVGPAVSKDLLGNLAFARDGQGRLKSYEVPLADAGLWRVGFAVTDALGLAEELDRYRALNSDASSNDTDTAKYILGKMLSRLRGDFAPNGALPRHPEAKYLPATVFRALSLLRSFPASGSPASELCYLLAVECESSAMQLRATGNMDGTRDGVLFQMLAEVAPSVFLRLPEMRLEGLPPLDTPEAFSEQRRSVAAWNVLDRRLQLLEDIAPEKLSPSATDGWKALRYALRAAALKAWIRALVFELEIAGETPPIRNATVPAEWGLEEDCVLVADGNGTDLYQVYSDALTPEGRLSSLAHITPLGWLTLLAQRLNLYGEASARTYLSGPSAVGIPERVTELARVLATKCKADAITPEEWPFDALKCVEGVLNDATVASAQQTLSQLDSALGLRVALVQSDIWGIQPHSKTFTDHKGKAWKMSRLLVEQLGRDRYIEAIDVGRGVTRLWTETRNPDGDLVGVSALGLDFSRTVGFGSQPMLTPNGASPRTSFRNGPLGGAENEGVAPVLPPEVKLETSDETSTRSDVPPATPTSEFRRDLSTAQAGDRAGARSQDSLSAWGTLQRGEWLRRRSFKSRGHVRFAFFQFRIDDSYVHPLLDVGFPDEIEQSFGNDIQRRAERTEAIAQMTKRTQGSACEEVATEPGKGGNTAIFSECQRARAAASTAGDEALWQESALLPSWKEHRRRRLLEEAISSCEAFRVDVLVLPEYSIRPDTIAWLKNHLEARAAKVSVLAGTYRLHGSRNDIHFTESFKNIFGLADGAEVFSDSGRSKEKSAYLTLLHPIELNNRRNLVTVFSRRKKYQSIAMKELINPPDARWAPLLNIRELIEYIKAQLKKQGEPDIDVNQAVDLSRRLYPAERMAELVCSELFASTHPVNAVAIQQEYHALRLRFGDTRIRNDDDSLTEDIKAFTESLTHTTGLVDRRSIIVVPACTTRSADYWIYGQSALLASGLTTVFCAAVLGDSKQEGGGSCFIGKSSWNGSSDTPGMISLITPYSGWSRGIYYNKPSDALGKQEQALVIADLDPVYMNEGKPRPQTLPVPISLVAHLPIVESANLEQLRASFSLANGAPSRGASSSESKWPTPLGLHDHDDIVQAVSSLQEQLSSHSPSQVLDPSATIPGTTQSVVSAAAQLNSFFSDKTAWSSRLGCWRKNWRELPYYGIPPTLLDWLHVDLTPPPELPKVFVPPWGSSNSGDVLTKELGINEPTDSQSSS